MRLSKNLAAATGKNPPFEVAEMQNAGQYICFVDRARSFPPHPSVHQSYRLA